MSRIYLPNSKQFKEMNVHLQAIANAVSVRTDWSDWEGVQRAVKHGIAPDVFPIGTRLVVAHTTYGELPFRVVAHNHYKSANDENAPTMTIMCDVSVDTCIYDAPEAFYYAESELPAGTYNIMLPSNYFVWKAGLYQFTLSKGLPSGGQLAIAGKAHTALTSLSVYSYSNAGTSTPIEEVAITSGSSGVSLGSLGQSLNSSRRVSFGSNNYKESVVRQFLNGSGTQGNWWKAQTRYDRAPTSINANSFTPGLDDDFLSVVGEVIVPCTSNIDYESSDSEITIGNKYTVSDKFYLPSMKEIYGISPDYFVDDSELFPYFEDAMDVWRRRTSTDGELMSYWTRTPDEDLCNTVYSVSSNGDLSSGEADLASSTGNPVMGVVPVCTIV